MFFTIAKLRKVDFSWLTLLPKVFILFEPLVVVFLLPRAVTEVQGVFFPMERVDGQATAHTLLVEPCAGIVAIIWELVTQCPHLIAIEIADMVLAEHRHVNPAEEGTQYRWYAVGTMLHTTRCSIMAVGYRGNVAVNQYVRVHQDKTIWQIVHQPVHAHGVLGRTVVRTVAVVVLAVGI